MMLVKSSVPSFLPLRTPAVVAIFAIVVACSSTASAYLPVICMHGYHGTAADFDHVVEWTKEIHPGTDIVSLPLYEGKNSTHNMWEMADAVVEYIRGRKDELKDGFILIGHSQGALLTRSVLELLGEDNTVKTYISLAGPQMGQWGVLGDDPKWLQDFEDKNAWIVLYTKYAQKTFSGANYWHDPRHESIFLKDSVYLPVINNEVDHGNADSFKDSFLRTGNAVFLGGPQDGTIQPWQSTQWGFLSAEGDAVPMEQQNVYMDDLFGLKTMDEQGRLNVSSVPGAKHMDWVRDRQLFDEYIAPWLE